MPTSVWRGHISFGLISIPVRLFKAARAERISLKQVYRVPAVRNATPPPEEVYEPEEVDDEPSVPLEAAVEEVAPVRRLSAVEGSREIIPESAVTKGFEFQPDRFVTLDRDELKALEEKTSKQMDVLEFVDVAAVDPVYFETSYYVRPDPAGEKPYALLFEAIRRAGLVALARFAMHRREHVALLRAGRRGLLVHTMFYSTEVRAQEEFEADTGLVVDKEVELAELLVRNLRAEFDPSKFHDSYKQKLEALIEAKVRGREVVRAASTAGSGAAPVIDIMEALRASLATLKKPPQPAAVVKPLSGRKRKG